jgi:O-antigen ligase
LLIVGAIAVAGPSLPALSVTRFASLLEFVQTSDASIPGAGGETSAAARIVLFQFAIHLWTLSPLIGTGTAGFQVLSGSSLGPYADVYPHNALLQVSAEHGLLGLALFVAVVCVGLLRRLPPGRTSLTLRVLFAFSLLNAMVSGDIFTDRETLGLLMLILAFEVPVVASSRSVASRDPDSVPVAPHRSWQIGIDAGRSGSARRQPALAQPGVPQWSPNPTTRPPE